MLSLTLWTVADYQAESSPVALQPLLEVSSCNTDIAVTAMLEAIGPVLHGMRQDVVALVKYQRPGSCKPPVEHEKTLGWGVAQAAVLDLGELLEELTLEERPLVFNQTADLGCVDYLG